VSREPSASALPPGPPLPSLVNVFMLLGPGRRWALSYLSWCSQRWGNRGGGAFTLRAFSTIVFVVDRRAARAAALADIEQVHAGEANAILRPLVGDSVITMDGPEMLQRKRLVIAPLHNAEFLSLAAKTMADITESAVASWPRERSFALRPRLQEITLEIIIRLVFGAEAGREATELRDRVLHLLDVCDPPLFLMLFWPDMYAGTGPVSRAAGPIVRWLARTGQGPWGGFQRALAAVDEVVHELIDRRAADPRAAERRDILSLLVHNARGVRVERTVLRNELMTFLLAGHETTASALAWLFDLLLHDSEALARVRADLACGDDAFLDAAIVETLRLRPPIRELGRTLVEPYELCLGEGPWARRYRLPRRTADGRRVVLMPSVWLVHHDPGNYPDQERFRPERFLGRKPDPSNWLPFGGGQRQCAGYRFAPFEIREVAKAILASVRLRAASPHLERPVERRVTMEPLHGTRVVVTGPRSTCRLAT
jgi:cytochrome P450 family 135